MKVKGLLPKWNTADKEVDLGLKDAASTLSPIKYCELDDSAVLKNITGSTDSEETMGTDQFLKEKRDGREYGGVSHNRQPDGNVPSTAPISGGSSGISASPASSTTESFQRMQEKIIHQETIKVENHTSFISNLDVVEDCEILSNPHIKRVYGPAKRMKKPLQASLTPNIQTLPEKYAGSNELLFNINSSRLITLPDIYLGDTLTSEDICLSGYSSLVAKLNRNDAGKNLHQTAKGPTSPSALKISTPNSMKEGVCLPEDNVNSNLAVNSLHITKEATPSSASECKTPISNQANQNNSHLDMNQVLTHRKKKKVCFVPPKDVSLSKTRIQKVIAEQFGVNVPLDSKLLKVFYKNIRRFKANYKKKMKNGEKIQTSHEIKEKSDVPLKGKNKCISRSRRDISNLNHQCENPNSFETIYTNPARIDRKNLSVNSRKKYNCLSEASNSRLKNNQNVKKAPNFYDIRFLGSCLNKAATDNHLSRGISAQCENIFSIPASIRNVYDKSQLEMLCQTFIETLHQLDKSEVEETEVKLVVSIIKNSEAYSSSEVNKELVSGKTAIRRRSNNCATNLLAERIIPTGNEFSQIQENIFDFDFSGGMGNQDLLTIS